MKVSTPSRSSFLDLVLVELAVHEDVQRVGEVGVGHFLAIEDDRLQLVVGLEHGLGTGAGQQVLQLHLDDGSVTAGLVELGLLDDPGSAIDVGNLAGAELLSGFHTNIRWMKDKNQAAYHSQSA